ncbi:MAG: 2-C-methyl-D-erythritol 4-phosphate cytidylyltransferase [Solirubrobacteraceae bacterium]|jgi:2-C-methyl-D-erythritol 4-phosphate cytidylyltransferase|nr:2-C-methyl-D-erythritol 4-phosphate cytidylyltransferase [Solirubrobacteraceae bacterium]
MAVALLVAAGSGERLGSDRPKAFAMLGGRPMLEWSVDALRAAGIEEIVVALPEGQEAPEGTVGVRGGETRADSVRVAFDASTGDPVVVHDAARPLVTPEVIESALAALGGDVDGVVVAAPVIDTVKRVEDGVVRETVPREGLWAAQTPQVLRRAALKRGLAETSGPVTDDVALVEGFGRVRVVEGPPENFKVTTPADLVAAEALLRRRRRLAVVRDIIAAVNEGRMEAPFAHYHDDVVWDLTATKDVLATDEVYRGHDGLRRYWREWLSAWETVRFEVEEMFAVGDHVVQYQRQVMRGRHSGAEVAAEDYAQVFSFRGEKISAMHFFDDRDEAVRFAREN